MALPPDGQVEPQAPGHDPAREQELRAWFVEHGPALRRYFRKRAGELEADDLVHDVFLRLQSRAAGGAVDNVERYLFRVANNVLATRAVRGGRGWRGRETYDEGLVPPDDVSPERILAGKQEMARVIAAVRRLPPRTRQAFVFHRFDEMTYPAIARRMGVSVSAVEQLIARALDRIAAEARRGP